MSKTRFTPGPWFLEKWVDPPNELGVEWPNWNIEADSLNDGRGGIVCELPAPSRGYPEIDAAVDATALLIAAAPDLYAALEVVTQTDDHADPEVRAVVRAALAKARGEK